jgi:hypothetical protein
MSEHKVKAHIRDDAVEVWGNDALTIYKAETACESMIADGLHMLELTKVKVALPRSFREGFIDGAQAAAIHALEAMHGVLIEVCEKPSCLSVFGAGADAVSRAAQACADRINDLAPPRVEPVIVELPAAAKYAFLHSHLPALKEAHPGVSFDVYWNKPRMKLRGRFGAAIQPEVMAAAVAACEAAVAAITSKQAKKGKNKAQRAAAAAGASSDAR